MELEAKRDAMLQLEQKIMRRMWAVREQIKRFADDNGLSRDQDGDLNRELWRLIGFCEGLCEAAAMASLSAHAP